jgi:hypothetical protein
MSTPGWSFDGRQGWTTGGPGAGRRRGRYSSSTAGRARSTSRDEALVAGAAGGHRPVSQGAPARPTPRAHEDDQDVYGTHTTRRRQLLGQPTPLPDLRNTIGKPFRKDALLWRNCRLPRRQPAARTVSSRWRNHRQRRATAAGQIAAKEPPLAARDACRPLLRRSDFLVVAHRSGATAAHQVQCPLPAHSRRWPRVTQYPTRPMPDQAPVAQPPLQPPRNRHIRMITQPCATASQP